MASKNNSFDEVEKLLQDLGKRIEELIEKGAEASGDLKVEFERKIEELKLNKDKLEKDFKRKKATIDKKLRAKTKTAEPKLKKSLEHFIAGFKQFGEAIKILFQSNK